MWKPSSTVICLFSKLQLISLRYGRVLFCYTNKGSSTSRDVISTDMCGQIGARQTCRVVKLHVVKSIPESPILLFPWFILRDSRTRFEIVHKRVLINFTTRHFITSIISRIRKRYVDTSFCKYPHIFKSKKIEKKKR